MIHMADIGVSEFILVIAAIIMGLVIFGLTAAYLIPIYTFTNAEQQANAISQSVYITLSPPAISSSLNVSFLGYIYSPLYSGNYTIVAFSIPSSAVPSVAITPPVSEQFSVYLVSLSTTGTTNLVKTSSISIPIVYDVNGHSLATNVIGYKVPANVPFEIVGNLNSNNVLVVWVIYYSSGYHFRVAYTYSYG